MLSCNKVVLSLKIGKTMQLCLIKRRKSTEELSLNMAVPDQQVHNKHDQVLDH